MVGHQDDRLAGDFNATSIILWCAKTSPHDNFNVMHTSMLFGSSSSDHVQMVNGMDF